MRLDKFLKVSRLIKRRTVANEACDAEKKFLSAGGANCSRDAGSRKGVLAVFPAGRVVQGDEYGGTDSYSQSCVFQS